MKIPKRRKLRIIRFAKTHTLGETAKHFGMHRNHTKCIVDIKYGKKCSQEISDRSKRKREKDPKYKRIWINRIKAWERNRCAADPEFKQTLKLRREFNKRKRQLKAIKLNQYYTAADRKYTLDLFDYKCAACGSPINLHLDHWYPLSKGHVLSRLNAVVLCAKCNQTKSSKLPLEVFDTEVVRQIESKLFAT